MQTKFLIIKKILLSILLFLFQSGYALNLQEALVSAYNTSQILRQNRMDFFVELEKVAVARAGFFPDVSATVQVNNSQKKDVGNSGTGSAAKGRAVTNSLIINQNLIDCTSYANVKAANLNFKAAKATLEGQEQEVFLKAITAYLDYEFAKTTYQTSQASVDFNTKNTDSVEAKLKFGEANNTEVALAQSELSKSKSERSQYASELERRKASFQELIGLNPSLLEEPQIPDLPSTLSDFRAKALAYNSNLERAKQIAQSAQANTMATAGMLLPSLNLSFAFSRGHNDFMNPTERNSSSIESKLTLYVPIFPQGGASYSKVRQAKYQSRKAAFNLEQELRNLESQIIYLWESFHALKSALDSATVALQAQKLALEGTVQEFKLGLKSILDVLNVESSLTSRQIHRAKFLRDYTLQAYIIKAFIGELSAKKLQLKVDYFDPDKELRKIKAPSMCF